MKKSLLAAALMVAGSSAYADPFYMDIGTDYSATDSDQVCPTCTSMKDELLFTYQSSTTIVDNGDGVIGAGDTIITDGGLVVGGLANNLVTDFTPAEVFGSNSNNGYGSDWLMSFSVENLVGVVTGVSGTGVPEFAYGPGLLELFVLFPGDVPPYNNFMDIAITGGGATGVSTILTGTADFTNVDAGYNDLFHSGLKNCEGDDSFFAIWSNCGEGAGDALTIDFFASFDTNIFVSDFTYDPDLGIFTLTSDHDGSATFTVPEPSTILLIGSMALLGGLARRSKKV